MDLSANRVSPVVDYTSADFESMTSDLVAYAQGKYSALWTAYVPNDFNMMYVELAAYLGDLLSYQTNSLLQESFVTSARRRQSLVNIGRSVGFRPREAEAASVVMALTLDPDAGLYPATVGLDAVVSNGAGGEAEVFYSPRAALDIPSYPIAGFVEIECVEGERVTDILVGVGTGAPNQRFQVPQQGVLGSSITLVIGSSVWAEVDNLVLSAATARHYRRITDEIGNTFLAFGDGTYGAVPPSGSELRASFRIAGGIRGNIPKGLINEKVSMPQCVLSITNAADATGGKEAATLREAKGALATRNATLQRAVTLEDYQALASTLPGISRVRASAGQPRGSRTVSLFVAPSGGGEVTPALAVSVSRFFKTASMVNERVNVFSALYRECGLSLLVHVDNDFRAAAVKQLVREQLYTARDSGILNFSQLDFAAAGKDDEGRPLDLLSTTRLQALFEALRPSGVNRVEIVGLTANPKALKPLQGNTGNGDITITNLAPNRKRRQYVVTFLAANRYAVRERLKGRVSQVATYSLVDEAADFTAETENFSAGWRLVPDRGSAASVAVLSAEGQTINVENRYTLYSVTQPGATYYLVSPSTSGYNVTDTFTSDDGLVSFKPVVGSKPFAAGDVLVVDVFPQRGDVLLEEEEFPTFSSDSLEIRTSGGIRV
jgi:hypothetical protein